MEAVNSKKVHIIKYVSDIDDRVAMVLQGVAYGYTMFAIRAICLITSLMLQRRNAMHTE